MALILIKPLFTRLINGRSKPTRSKSLLSCDSIALKKTAISNDESGFSVHSPMDQKFDTKHKRTKMHDVFHPRCLHMVHGLTWQEEATSTAVLQQAELTKVNKNKMAWTCEVDGRQETSETAFT